MRNLIALLMDVEWIIMDKKECLMKSNPRKKSRKEEVVQPVFCNDSEDEEYEEHPEVIQIDEQNAGGNADSNDEEDDEDDDEVEQRMSHRN
ncbi:hypothetical protein G6F56_013917 [Rhizopus delemar]|nr:hypothetical protein G6F56_013917 [Rhizopus delemar]